jgi:hypothetical protein
VQALVCHQGSPQGQRHSELIDTNSLFKGGANITENLLMTTSIASFDYVAQLGTFIKERFKNQDLKVSAFFINDSLSQALGYKGHDHLLHHAADQVRTILPKFNDDQVLNVFWNKLVDKIGADTILEARNRHNEKTNSKKLLIAKKAMSSALKKLTADESAPHEVNESSPTIEFIKAELFNSLRNQVELMAEVRIKKDDILSFINSYRSAAINADEMSRLAKLAFDKAGNPECFSSFSELGELFTIRSLSKFVSEEKIHSYETCFLVGLLSVDRKELMSYLEAERGYKFPFKLRHPNAFLEGQKTYIAESSVNKMDERVLLAVRDDIKMVRTIISELPVA